jgi:hypothetical protein
MGYNDMHYVVQQPVTQKNKSSVHQHHHVPEGLGVFPVP